MVILLMGVSGSGKTKIGTLLAQELGWKFQDADHFHSPANITKMSQGIPLTDADRAPWLHMLGEAITQWLHESTNIVLACSALKASYRKHLHINHPQVKLVYLKGTPACLAERLKNRQGHFLKLELLNSQLETLEEPEQGLHINISQSPQIIVKQIRENL